MIFMRLVLVLWISAVAIVAGILIYAVARSEQEREKVYLTQSCPPLPVLRLGLYKPEFLLYTTSPEYLR